jgi:hypothetical protein
MRILYLLLTIISCAAWVHGAPPPEPHNTAAQQTSPQNRANTNDRSGVPVDDSNHQETGRTPAEGLASRHISRPGHPRNSDPLRTNRSRQILNSSQRATSGYGANARQATSERESAGRAKLHANQTPNHTVSIRPAQALGGVPTGLRHRGPNPAVLSGEGRSKGANIATIGRTHLDRRP